MFCVRERERVCVCETEREKERECVYVCVCVCERERERECVCTCACDYNVLETLSTFFDCTLGLRFVLCCMRGIDSHALSVLAKACGCL